MRSMRPTQDQLWNPNDAIIIPDTPVSPDTTGFSSTSFVPNSDDYRIDALIDVYPWGGRKWGGGVGTGVDLTFSFPGPGSDFSGYYSVYDYWTDSQFTRFNEIQQFWFGEALNRWAEVADISFTRVSDLPPDDDFGVLRACISNHEPGPVASAYLPSNSLLGGDSWYRPLPGYWENPLPGTSNFKTFLHEIGHNLGFLHPFEGGVKLKGEEESFKYTLMSYNIGNYGGIPYHGAGDTSPRTPLLYDILAIQYMYGPNTSTRAGDDVYTFAAQPAEHRAIWDAGGIDEFDLSNQVAGAKVDLGAGAFSSIGLKANGDPAKDNISIAFGVTIENVKGTTHNDTILGSDVENEILGETEMTFSTGVQGVTLSTAVQETMFSSDAAATIISTAVQERTLSALGQATMLSCAISRIIPSMVVLELTNCTSLPVNFQKI